MYISFHHLRNGYISLFYGHQCPKLMRCSLDSLAFFKTALLGKTKTLFMKTKLLFPKTKLLFPKTKLLSRKLSYFSRKLRRFPLKVLQFYGKA